MAARLARQFGASTEGRLSWADAGGSTPSLGGVYPLNTAGVAVDLGTSPSILSTFNRIGSECFASMRIHSGTSPASGEGYTTIVGLPVAPKYVGSGNDGGHFIAHGELFDIANGGRIYPVKAAIDPAYSTTYPIIFVPFKVTSISATGLSATDVLTPRSFGSGTTLPIMHGTGTYPTYGSLSADPFDLAGGFILNLQFQYEAA